jgi:hypothetical protein
LIEVQAGGEDPGVCLGAQADPLRLIFRPSRIRLLMIETPGDVGLHAGTDREDLAPPFGLVEQVAPFLQHPMPSGRSALECRTGRPPHASHPIQARGVRRSPVGCVVRPSRDAVKNVDWLMKVTMIQCANEPTAFFLARGTLRVPNDTVPGPRTDQTHYGKVGRCASERWNPICDVDERRGVDEEQNWHEKQKKTWE